MRITNITEQCTGCGACLNACPKNAISMTETSEGFLTPIIDKSACVECGKCDAICPALKGEIYVNEFSGKQKYYAAMAMDEVRMVSTSGGAFYVLANGVLDSGGAVCGARFSDDFLSVHHAVIDKKEELFPLLTSKYVQSDTRGTHSEIKVLLDGGKACLFCGCPCQIAGLRAFLEKDYDNLYTIDLICHGVPSPNVWRMFAREKRGANRKIKYVNHRSKIRIWSTKYMMMMMMSDGVTELIKNTESYFQCFLRNYALRLCCYNCKYTNLNRQGDLTIGDFWGIEKHEPELDDTRGTSIILVNSPKGEKLLRDAEPSFKLLKEVPAEYADSSALYMLNKGSAKLDAAKRNQFFSLLSKYDFEKAFMYAAKTRYQVAVVGAAENTNIGATLTNFAAYNTIKNLGYTCAFVPTVDRKTITEPVQKDLADFLYSRCDFFKFRAEKDLTELNKTADNFVVISDILWHVPSFKTKRYFMGYADGKTHRKISFSTSFGKDELPPDDCQEMLKDFYAVSVRENVGVKLCRSIGVNAIKICDPVFTQPIDFYKSLIDERQYDVDGLKYIFSYDVSSFVQTQAAVALSQKLDNFTVKAMNSRNGEQATQKYKEGGLSKYHRNGADFIDWLYYTWNCEFVVSNSFHATCFALMFNKPFVTFSRGAHDPKLIDLLTAVGLMERLLPQGSEIPAEFVSAPIDWTSINIKMAEWRAEAVMWLKLQLEGAI